jgi:hypothetical protein
MDLVVSKGMKSVVWFILANVVSITLGMILCPTQTGKLAYLVIFPAFYLWTLRPMLKWFREQETSKMALAYFLHGSASVFALGLIAVVYDSAALLAE